MRDGFREVNRGHRNFFFFFCFFSPRVFCNPKDYSLPVPGGSVVKNLPADAGDVDSIPRLGRSPGGGNGNPLQYFCLEKSHGQRSLSSL